MKDKIIPILIVLGLSMFCGFVVIATGLGSLTSPLNGIAGPMVCDQRRLEIEAVAGTYIQGEQTHNVTAYCVNRQTGEKEDVSVEVMSTISRLQIVTGFVSGLVLFALFMIFLNSAARRLGKSFGELFQPSVQKT